MVQAWSKSLALHYTGHAGSDIHKIYDSSQEMFERHLRSFCDMFAVHVNIASVSSDGFQLSCH